MSGYIKYFKNGGKNMSFLIKDDEALEKFEQIWLWLKMNQVLNLIANLFMTKHT